MSLHKNVSISFVLFILIWIVLGLYVMPAADYATATDQGVGVYGIAKPVALTLISSGMDVMSLYVVHC